MIETTGIHISNEQDEKISFEKFLSENFPSTQNKFTSDEKEVIQILFKNHPTGNIDFKHLAYRSANEIDGFNSFLDYNKFNTFRPDNPQEPLDTKEYLFLGSLWIEVTKIYKKEEKSTEKDIYSILYTPNNQ